MQRKIWRNRGLSMSIISTEPTNGDVAAVEQLRSAYQKLRAEVGKVIVGQDEVVELCCRAAPC